MLVFPETRGVFQGSLLGMKIYRAIGVVPAVSCSFYVIPYNIWRLLKMGDFGN